MRVTRRYFTTAAATLLACGSVGCISGPDKTLLSKTMSKSEESFFEKLSFPGKKKNEAPEPYPNPVKIAATWTPDTILQTGRTPTRGFGGRVFFYDEKSRPVPVEGTLIVHGFDDSAENPADRVKRYEFTPEQFTRHFSQGDLGASYSIWIPWDAVGGTQRRVSLVTSFKASSGSTIQGIPATMMLPGSTPKPTKESEMAKMSPQYQRYVQATESGATRSTGLTTTTIRRRTPSAQLPIETAKPGITIPNAQPGSMMAAGRPTPAVDIQMRRRTLRSNVMPASAELPIQR